MDHTLDATALRALLVEGKIASAEIGAATRAACARVNPDLNALTMPPFDVALDANPTGSLAGVPFVIKDSAPFARGVPFTLGSRSIRGAISAADHPMMTKFRRAGLVAFGQTTTPEWSLNFATESLRYGVTRNPWDRERGVGGSSGGSAALVAAGVVPVGHASDGAGSIRIPAACCGVIGLKPSRGRTSPAEPAVRVPGSGGHEIGAALAVDFAVTRTVRDTALLLTLLDEPGWSTGCGLGQDVKSPPLVRSTPRGPALTGTRPLHVAISTAAWSAVPVDAEVAAATEAVGKMLEWIGHRVSRSTPLFAAGDITAGAMLGVLHAGQAILAAPVQPDRRLLERVSRSVLAATETLTADAALTAVAAQDRLTRTADSFFARYDILVTPTLAQLPPRHGTLDYNNPRGSDSDVPAHRMHTWLEQMFEVGPFTAAFNITGNPAISLPLGQSVLGLPIGVQLVAGHGQDELVLAVAADLENALPWRGRLPPIFAD